MNNARALFLFAFIALITLNISCKKENDSVDYNKYRLIAWTSLNESEKETVLHNWADADAQLSKNPDNNDNVIVVVVFRTKYDALSGPITVYIDIKTEKVIYPKNIALPL